MDKDPDTSSVFGFFYGFKDPFKNKNRNQIN